MSGGGEVRKRGRPKGSVNKRAKDLKGYVDARFGGSAAQQMAAACMVTPAEVRQAGGVLEARVQKARELKAAIGCTLKEAFEILSKELAALAPYTDQRQPLAVERVGEGWRPDVVFMGAAPVAGLAQAETEIVGEFRVIEAEVSRLKSHDDSQAVDLLDLLPPAATD